MSKRRLANLAAGLVLLLIATGVAFAFWPVCVPLAEESVTAADPPLAQRADRDFHVRVFQQRDGRWCQCKTRISRFFFF